ncbi:MFS transporter [Texcoconibacillus texcoconensis]|uniref:NNP family nitrate/nitrite transporter-like MFS transporter n=1 Tax=Texcoconibacillus texcoconensis TaxID=1095777 RepID=A0A840QPQ2_9BACI|nr:MFS transporter [Texcoconibacillus texcoconensis]MBB5173396.1 NNP family nitrate/nitrite transporter-like MFS transporter [Texcoconibacillus texcoconensis]
MRPNEVMDVKNEQIRTLHLTWIAFFVSFFAWFNMAPLSASMVESEGWLTSGHLEALAIVNLALTIPARVVIGALLDKYGPRLVFSWLLIIMSVPVFMFAFGTSWMQLLIARLFISCIGASFVVGIRMVSEWFPPKKVGFAEGFYAGFGNFGSAAGAMILPWVALQFFGGDDGWRYAIAFTGLVSLVYGFIYMFTVRDTPEGKTFHRAKNVSAMEVSSYKDLVQLIIWTIPLNGALAVLAWRLMDMGFLSASAWYGIIAVLVVATVYQIVQILRVNLPILRRGVPEDDRYNFNNVAALNTTYFANFGAELAIISMLPIFFLTTFDLTPTTAGLVASSFAFVNLFARPVGGWLSDRMGNRRVTMLIYMIGISIGLFAMAGINSGWPLILAILVTLLTSLFIQGAEGATFAIIPFVKKRLTGQVSGMAGAYGNVGSVIYLTIYTFVTPTQFFMILGAGALFSFVYCYFFLEEPEGSFADDYQVSSVDLKQQEIDLQEPKPIQGQKI